MEMSGLMSTESYEILKLTDLISPEFLWISHSAEHIKISRLHSWWLQKEKHSLNLPACYKRTKLSSNFSEEREHDFSCLVFAPGSTV